MQPQTRILYALWTRITVYGARSAPSQQQELTRPCLSTVEHVGIYTDMSVGLRLGLVSLYVVLPRLRRGVALTEKS
jgi:hypothetical protein